MEEINDIGDVEGTYAMTGLLGDGGYGDLYVAYDPERGERVAIKTQKPWRTGRRSLHEIYGDDLADEGVRMFKLSGISAVPKIFAVGTYRGDRCLVMEYIDGRQLRDAMMDRRPVKDPGTVASVIGQLCEILWEVHAENLVHCDLKPENVIVEPNGRLRLIDMGEAVSMGTETKRDHGTPGYASPEQLEDNLVGLTKQADIFALGCILLEMTVMRLPYGGVERRVERGFPVLPAERLAQVPPQFLDVALHMVQWDPEERPADVREVFDRIRPYLPALGSRKPLKPLSPDPTEYYRARSPRRF